MLSFYQSTIGKKFILAVTGMMLFGFLIGHVMGNLKIFKGFDSETGIHKIDTYSHFLREMGSPLFSQGELLWIARLGLLGAVALHIITAIQLTKRNRESRPDKYVCKKDEAASYASLSMWVTGPLVGIYVIYHLLHLTWGSVHPNFEHGKVYSNLYEGFQSFWVFVIYVLSVIFLGLHLNHGLWSFFQTLGLDNSKYRNILKIGSKVIAVLLALGYIVVPFALYFKQLPFPKG